MVTSDIVCTLRDHALYREVLRARAAAHVKHSDKSIEARDPDDLEWLAILGEEFGEVARTLTYDGGGDLRHELIDLIAVASAWVDAMDRTEMKL